MVWISWAQRSFLKWSCVCEMVSPWSMKCPSFLTQQLKKSYCLTSRERLRPKYLVLTETKASLGLYDLRMEMMPVKLTKCALKWKWMANTSWSMSSKMSQK